jgi:type IV pilus assembly protein PilW
MPSRRSSAEHLPARQGGFTLIELMIGMLIGLLATVAVSFVLVNSEGQKRTTTAGSDAQVNGALALTTLQRTVSSAGYGFAATPAVIGCPLTAQYSGAPVAMPANLVPLIITQGAGGAPDSIRVFSSGKKTFAVPLPVVGYTVGDGDFKISSIRGIEAGDLVIAAKTAGSPCEMFRATSIASATDINKDSGDLWNGANNPANTYTGGDLLINMGAPLDVKYAIVNNSLRSTSLNIDGAGQPSYDAQPLELFPNIVTMRALYGKDTDGNGSLDTWDNVTPATNADWLKVVAVRVAIVSRSGQYEKDEVTFDDPTWDVGTAAPVAGSAVCGSSNCLTLTINTSAADWKHYRYRVFDTVIPLRNMLWNS